MEMRGNNNGEKRRRKIIQKGPILVRSVKPGQLSAFSGQKENTGSMNLWKN